MIGALVRALGRRLRGVRAGAEYRVGEDPRFAHCPRIELRSDDFADGAPLPPGTGSPHLAWSGLPPDTRYVALLVEDVDVPFPRPRTHGIAYDLSPDTSSLARGAIQPFRAPQPIPGHGRHRYVFTVLASDYVPRFDQEPNRGRLLDALAGHVVALGELTGTRETV